MLNITTLASVMHDIVITCLSGVMRLVAKTLPSWIFWCMHKNMLIKYNTIKNICNEHMVSRSQIWGADANDAKTSARSIYFIVAFVLFYFTCVDGRRQLVDVCCCTARSRMWSVVCHKWTTALLGQRSRDVPDT